MPYFAPDYFAPAWFDAPEADFPQAPLGAVSDYFDCDYFDQTYFDTPDCAPTGGSHRVRRHVIRPAPLDEADELLALI